MRPLHHVCLATLYSVAALLAGLTMPRFVGGLDVTEGYLIGTAVLGFGAALHYSLMRSGGFVVSSPPLLVLNGLAPVQLDHPGLAPGGAPALARLTMPEPTPSAPNAQPVPAADTTAKVVAEVKVLQSLVEQLYASRAAPAAEAIPAPVRDVATASPAAAAGLGPAKRSIPAHPAAMRPRPVPQAPDSEATLDALRDALRTGQVELALQPIVSLPQRKKLFYEAFSRIRVGDGLFLMPGQYIDLAERVGLITAIDNTLLFRCIQLLRKTRERSLDIRFFCNISQHTLADRAFFREFVHLMRDNASLSSSIVFEFPQRAVETPGDGLRRDLQELGRLGFHFSLDQVVDLDLDPDQLAARHFRFVKIDAGRLLAPERVVGAAELKRRLETRGIALIVEKLESEATLVELLDADVEYGQGYLFGEPRLSRGEG